MAKLKKATTESKSNFSPLDDRVLVQPLSEERKTPGGLIIPDTVEQAGQFKGKVVSVGRGRMNKKGHVQPLAIKKGETVLFPEHSGTSFELNGKKVFILRESEILGVLE